jgi:FkbM family methyltransferase
MSRGIFDIAVRHAGRAQTFLRLLTTRTVKIGARDYSVTPFFRNELVQVALRSSAYEATLTEIFRASLALRPGAVLDVGANRGQTLIKLLSLDKDRLYIGFEPQSSCCALIERFIEDNHLTNHQVIPIGLSDEAGLARLGLCTRNDVKASIVEEYRPREFFQRHRLVPVFRGDDVPLVAELASVCLIKIDVEGAELEVIRGLARTIETHKPVMVFEVLPNRLVSTGASLSADIIAVRNRRYREIEAELVGRGYSLYHFDNAGCLIRTHSVEPAADAIRNYVALSDIDENRFLSGAGPRLRVSV